MARKHFVGLILAALLMFSGSAQAQSPVEERTCVFYSLSDLGNDPNLGEWIVETLPNLIEPRSWGNYEGGPAAIRYYAPRKLLMVYQTPTNHSKIAAFLQNLKKELNDAGSKKGHADRGVVPAQYTEPRSFKPSEPAQAMPYAVPAPAKQPKHLFHFIIRYEGAGIIDENVAEVLKALNGATGPQPSEASKPPQPEAPDAPMPPAEDAPSAPRGVSFTAPLTPLESPYQNHRAQYQSPSARAGSEIRHTQHVPGATKRNAEPTKTHASPSSALAPPKHLFHFIIRYEGAGPDDGKWTDYLPFYYLNQYDSDPNIRMQKELNEPKTPVSTLPPTGVSGPSNSQPFSPR